MLFVALVPSSNFEKYDEVFGEKDRGCVLGGATCVLVMADCGPQEAAAAMFYVSEVYKRELDV